MKKKARRRPKTKSTPQPMEDARRELLAAAADPVDGTHWGKDWKNLNVKQQGMRRATMLQCIQLGAPKTSIRALMDETYGCDKENCDGIWREVVKDLRADFEEGLPYAKAEVIARVRRDLAEMRGVPKGVPKAWSKILAHERFLARIEGTEAPIKVAMLDVNEAMRDNLASSLANSTDERLNMLMEKGRQAKQLIETSGTDA